MRPGVILLALWTLLNIVLTVRLVLPGDEDPGPVATEVSADSRTPIQLPPEARDAVLAEMRLMLGSVQGVIDGVARSDTTAIRRAAAASGLVMAADPALEQVLPQQFLLMGMATHQAFDSLAANASAGPTAAVERLADITGRCVACHAVYRLGLQ
jgi:hypothetical protein